MSKKRETPPQKGSSPITFLVGIAYLVLGLTWGAIFHGENFSHFAQWFLMIAFIGLINIFVIGQILKVTMILNTLGPGSKTPIKIQLVIWSSLKLVILAGIAFIAYQFGSIIPPSALLLGLMTFVMVPFFGALVGIYRTNKKGD